MPPLNHLPESHVKSVIGKALIIGKVTALPEHPPPPFPAPWVQTRTDGPAGPLVPDHWTEYEELGCSGFGHAKLILSFQVHNKRLRALVGPGHRNAACPRHCCISTNAIRLLADTLGFLLSC